MSKLIWDQAADRTYETGVDKGVLYPKDPASTDKTKPYAAGVAWSGLTSVTESPSGAEPTTLYADNIEYLNLMSNEKLGLTIEAYTYPDEFAQCDGSASLATGVTIGQQKRKGFGFCYRSAIGNNDEGSDYGYKLHLIYNCLAAPSERQHQTINESPEAATMSWSISTTPEAVTGHKGTACVTIDSTKVDATKLAALEKILYGADANEGNTQAVAPRLPLPDEVATLMADNAG